MSSARLAVTTSSVLHTAHVAVSGGIDMSDGGALEKIIAEAVMVPPVRSEPEVVVRMSGYRR